MKAFLRKTIVGILFVIPLLLTASASATIHGVVYEWNTFKPLENVIVQVNSTPLQSMVCKYGTYSFELPKGNYKISASYYENNYLSYYGEDFVNITDEGSYVLDLLLFPDYPQNRSSINTSLPSSSSSSQNQYLNGQNDTLSQNGFISINIILTTILVLLILFIWLRNSTSINLNPSAVRNLVKKKEFPEEKVIQTSKLVEPQHTIESYEINSTESNLSLEEPIDSTELIVPKPQITESSTATEMQKGPLPADLQEILDLIRSQGGRMTQKDLRSKLKYSEGKVSLMLFDLERRGIIEKFKRGRGNVIILVENDQQS
ncbi:MAG: winged helix-turn-helix transcriptional regulator [Methanomethylovorans sp.]|jgi:uncharacterized membrane protein|nr:winged helix-turn-helix transcriptional regulator [Methanomethylovorans sp.]